MEYKYGKGKRIENMRENAKVENIPVVVSLGTVLLFAQVLINQSIFAYFKSIKLVFLINIYLSCSWNCFSEDILYLYLLEKLIFFFVSFNIVKNHIII